MRLAFAAVTLLHVAASPAATPTYAEVLAGYRSSETAFTDRHGEVVQVLRTDASVRKLAWTPLDGISPALRTALVLSEDQRFYAHSGVDWKAVGAAAWGNFWNTKTRGASTITMQLAGLLDDDLRAGDGGRSVGQKLSQAATALALERTWRKDQILEAYLNLVGYRGEIVGVAALSATLFEKYPSGLDAREAAITAALVRAPNAPASRVTERACAILQAESLPDECRGLPAYAAQVLSRKAAPRLDSDPQLAPQFARAVLRNATNARRTVDGNGPRRATPAGAVVATTLDARLQRFARATLRSHLAELAARNVEDGAVVVLDNARGDVLAWVGSSGSLSGAAEVDHVVAPRQAGSTLKPFLYELAIEKRWLTAASILDDSPVDLATAGGLYIPQNYDHDFKGPVSVRTALASSLNVPAVRTLVMVTPERFHQRLRALGFSTLRESGDYYGYSLALGSAEVTLADLANAYRVLANGGVAGPIATTPTSAAEDDPRASGARATAAAHPADWRPGGSRPLVGPPATRAIRAMDAGASAIVADVLSDRTARTTTFGMDSVLSTRGWSAVKTGTSKDMRDNWCVGFTDRYTVGVWVGNASGASMWDVSGTTGAAPVWQAIVDELGRRDRRAASAPSTDADLAARGVVRRTVAFDHALEATRSELFLAGTETSRIVAGSAGPSMTATGAASIAGSTAASAAGDASPGTRRRTGAIAQPVDGTIVAIDPDIPALRQRLTFRTDVARPQGLRWRLDGRVVGTGPKHEWPVWPGRHTLELLDADERTVDAVRFEVRGAEVRSLDVRRGAIVRAAR